MNNKRWSLRALIFLVIALMVYWALRKAPLPEIWLALEKLQAWQIAAILSLNAICFGISTLRWWIIVEAESKHINYWTLLAARVSVFGISYFTLGPQVGGEPLQVLTLQRKYGLTYTRATASVAMDKILELLMNFILLAVGLASVFQAGVLIETSAKMAGNLALLIAAILWPPIHITLLYYQRYPVSALIHAFPFIPRNAKAVRFIRASERLTATFCRRHPHRLLAAIICSVLAGSGMLLDYAMITSFLSIDLLFWQTVAGWTMGWISLLVPLPGGLGAMESSQIFTLGKFGYGPAAALSVALVIRGRDIFIGGIGFLLAGKSLKR